MKSFKEFISEETFSVSDIKKWNEIAGLAFNGLNDALNLANNLSPNDIMKDSWVRGLTRDIKKLNSDFTKINHSFDNFVKNFNEGNEAEDSSKLLSMISIKLLSFVSLVRKLPAKNNSSFSSFDKNKIKDKAEKINKKINGMKRKLGRL